MEEKEVSYINVIPFVDIMLVLLTIVLTTSTFIATGGIEVELPKAEASSQPTDMPPKTVVIDRAGSLWLDGSPVSMEGLTLALNAVDRQTPVLVRADKSLALQGFVDVFAALKQQGFNQLLMCIQTGQGLLFQLVALLLQLLFPAGKFTVQPVLCTQGKINGNQQSHNQQKYQ